MPQLIPTQSIVVQRNGKNTIPEIGKPFAFTDSEVDDINAVSPDALRSPVNETVAAPVATDSTGTPAAAGKGKGKASETL